MVQLTEVMDAIMDRIQNAINCSEQSKLKEKVTLTQSTCTSPVVINQPVTSAIEWVGQSLNKLIIDTWSLTIDLWIASFPTPMSFTEIHFSDKRSKYYTGNETSQLIELLTSCTKQTHSEYISLPGQVYGSPYGSRCCKGHVHEKANDIRYLGATFTKVALVLE